jgi:hypothetical protein
MSDEGFDLYRINIPPETLASFRAEYAREMSAILVELSDVGAVVAMPAYSEYTLNKLRFMFNRSVSVVYATPEAIQFALDKYYPAHLVEIYVKAIGARGFHLVMAEPVGPMIFRLTGQVRDGEQWEFQPGELVRCEKKEWAGGRYLVAISPSPIG